MGGQLPSKAHVNFRQFTAVFEIGCKLLCAVVNLNFHNNLQCCLLMKIPLFMSGHESLMKSVLHLDISLVQIMSRSSILLVRISNLVPPPLLFLLI